MARGGSNLPQVSKARFKKLQTEVKNMGEALTETATDIGELQTDMEALGNDVGNAQTAITGTAGSAVVIGSDGKATTQPLAGTDYTTNRVRGASFHQNSAPSSLPNGCFAGVYEIS